MQEIPAALFMFLCDQEMCGEQCVYERSRSCHYDPNHFPSMHSVNHEHVKGLE